MTTKDALSLAMNCAAGHTNRVRSLHAIAKEMPESDFMRLVGQHPSTMTRDLEYAERDFQQAKDAYEAHCKEIGVPAYAFYTHD